MDKQQILTAAIKLAETLGYRGVYKRHLAAKLNCGMGTINYHWQTMDALRKAIVVEAINIGHVQIITQARALRDIKRETLSRVQREKLDALGTTVAA